jgi:hypothetical protein
LTRDLKAAFWFAAVIALMFVGIMFLTILRNEMGYAQGFTWPTQGKRPVYAAVPPSILVNETSVTYTTTTTAIAVVQQSSLSEISAIASAVAAVMSVLIAAYIYLDSKKEGPNIKYEDRPFILGLVEDEYVINDHGEIMFTNYGQKAGSLVKISAIGGTAFGLDETDESPRAKFEISKSDLPKLIQPYGTVTVRFTIHISSEKPMGELFEELNDDEKRFMFLYTITTRRGQRVRTGYVKLNLVTADEIIQP